MTLIPLAAIALLATCGSQKENNGQPVAPAPVAQGPTTPTRDQWQQCDTLFSLMQGVKGRMVADLFADDGYMTFKLIEAGANVIAVETDQAKVDSLNARKQRMGLGDDRLKVRKVAPGDPGIAMEEADVALIMHRFTRLPHPMALIARARAGLRSPKPVVIVDYLRVPTPVGPPLHERMTEVQVMDSMDVLMISDVGAYTQKLPYQYVVIAQDLVLSDEELEQMQKGTLPPDHR